MRKALSTPRRTRHWSRRPTAYAALQLPGAAHAWRSAATNRERGGENLLFISVELFKYIVPSKEHAKVTKRNYYHDEMDIRLSGAWAFSW